jgi:hypothetical protein
LILEIDLEDLLVWEDLSSLEDFWLIVCKARSNSGELDRDSTQFCICEMHYIYIYIYIYIGFVMNYMKVFQ